MLNTRKISDDDLKKLSIDKIGAICEELKAEIKGLEKEVRKEEERIEPLQEELTKDLKKLKWSLQNHEWDYRKLEPYYKNYEKIKFKEKCTRARQEIFKLMKKHKLGCYKDCIIGHVYLHLEEYTYFKVTNTHDKIIKDTADFLKDFLEIIKKYDFSNIKIGVNSLEWKRGELNPTAYLKLSFKGKRYNQEYKDTIYYNPYEI